MRDSKARCEQRVHPPPSLTQRCATVAQEQKQVDHGHQEQYLCSDTERDPSGSLQRSRGSFRHRCRSERCSCQWFPRGCVFGIPVSVAWGTRRISRGWRLWHMVDRDIDRVGHQPCRSRIHQSFFSATKYPYSIAPDLYASRIAWKWSKNKV